MPTKTYKRKKVLKGGESTINTYLKESIANKSFDKEKLHHFTASELEYLFIFIVLSKEIEHSKKQIFYDLLMEGDLFEKLKKKGVLKNINKIAIKRGINIKPLIDEQTKLIQPPSSEDISIGHIPEKEDISTSESEDQYNDLFNIYITNLIDEFKIELLEAKIINIEGYIEYDGNPIALLGYLKMTPHQDTKQVNLSNLVEREFETLCLENKIENKVELVNIFLKKMQKIYSENHTNVSYAIKEGKNKENSNEITEMQAMIWFALTEFRKIYQPSTGGRKRKTRKNKRKITKKNRRYGKRKTYRRKHNLL